MRLFIAARASVAHVIASALSSRNQRYVRNEGFLTAGEDCITWCGGPMLELVDPEAYNENYHQWRLDDLPIIPGAHDLQQQAWQIRERSQHSGQLEVIKKLLTQAQQLIHAGDPDREGQWLIDELLQYLGNDLPVKRLLIQDLNVQTVRAALANLRDNQEFIHISESAMARSRADWLYGINMTRAYTLLGRHAGYGGVLSVGRVQTPVLAMVVARDEATEQFKAQQYFEISAKICKESTEQYCYAKKKSPDCIFDADACKQIEKNTQGSSGVLTRVAETSFSEPPPLPFNLSALQIACSLCYGLSAKETQEIAWGLYETHHLISYPKTDSCYFPENVFEHAATILDAIAGNFGNEFDLAEKIRKSDCWIKQEAWKVEKAALHHAIMPTVKHVERSVLSEAEKQVYGIVALSFVAQFYPHYHRRDRKLEFIINNGEWSIEGSRVVQQGWRNVMPTELIQDNVALEICPDWMQGDIVQCEDISMKERQTRPPQRFTDASLMQAMMDIGGGAGLGTDSSRAFIIDGLCKRGFLMKGNKTLFSTAIARDLVNALPGRSQLVEMASRWEKKLVDIADARLGYSEAMADFSKELEELIAEIRTRKKLVLRSTDELLGLVSPEKFFCAKCQAILVQRSGKRGIFWGCSRYPQCKFTVPDCVDNDGRHSPDFASLDVVAISAKAMQKKTTAKTLGKYCPDCGKILVKRKGKRGAFAGCSGFPACSYTEVLLGNKEDID